ncbi:hypothetical protein D3C78_1315030 [compost metagenome]
MKLALHFDGSVAINTLRQAILAAGESTTIHYSAAHDLDASAMLSVLSAAGGEKNLVLGFDGARLDPRSLQQAVSFTGDRTCIDISAAQAVQPSALVTPAPGPGSRRQPDRHRHQHRPRPEPGRAPGADAGGGGRQAPQPVVQWRPGG